jgi:uncharacterized protein YdaU (DUF1376 family)
MSPTWMPFYVGDYLRDTRRLSTLEHGAYILLIMEYWLHGEVPTDDKALARVAQLTDREWAKVRPTLSRFFTDEWRHGRIDAELEKAEAKTKLRQEAGSRGGFAKAKGKQKPSKSPSNASASAPSNALASSSEDTSELRSSERGRAFESFISIYPRLTNQDAARQRLDERLDAGVPFEDILDGVRRYARQVSDTEERFIKNPDIWLEKGCWKDGVSPVVKTVAEGLNKVFVKADSEGGRAWRAYIFARTGKTAPCINGGWYYETEWPPAQEAAE